MRASMSLKTVLFSGAAFAAMAWPAPPPGAGHARRRRRSRGGARRPRHRRTMDRTGRIVVTGTRVVRDGYQAPTPLTVLTTEDIENTSPTNNIADFVNQLPALAGSTRPSNSRLNISSGQAGINALNLRNLGDGPHAHPAQRPALGRLDDHRRGRRQHDPADAGRAGRDRHRRRLGHLWLGRRRRRGQLHPQQRL